MPPGRGTLAALVLTALAAHAAPVPAFAAPEDDLQAAQRQANRAAEELAEAETELALADDAVAHLQTRVERTDARVSAVRGQVRDLAVRLYIEGTAPVARILRVGNAGDLIRAQQYSRIVAGTSTDALRQYRADREDLRQELGALEQQRETRAESLENLQRRRQEAVRELDRLSQLVAQARAAREAEERAQAAAQAAAAQASAAPAASSSRAAVASPDGSVSGSGNRLSPAPAPAAAPDPSPSPGADPPATTAGSAGWICPVQAPRAFSNDYGAPRGGGYSHMGNDILAPRGTPVVASVDGVVRHRSGAVSGLAYYLDGDDGNEYFGAHLDSYGASGRVAAGTVVGTVGNTGDAAGGPPHLHFEIHPGGSGNINPYPTLSRYC